MTKITVSSALAKDVREQLEGIVDEAFNNPGRRFMVIAELGVKDVTILGTAAADNAEPRVAVRITGVEVFSKEREDVARQAYEALYTERTSAGTLDEGSAEGQVLSHLAGLATINEPDTEKEPAE